MSTMNQITARQFKQNLPTNLSSSSFQGMLVEVLAKNPTLLNDPTIQKQLRDFCKNSKDLIDFSLKKPLTSDDLQQIISKLFAGGKVDGDKLFSFVDAFDKNNRNDSFSKGSFADKMYSTLIGTPQKELERYRAQESHNPGYRAYFHQKNTTNPSLHSTKANEKNETTKGISSEQTKGVQVAKKIDLSNNKQLFVYKTDELYLGGFSIRLPVEERSTEKKSYHITGPQKGGDIVWNQGIARLHKDIREGKCSSGILLHKDKIEVKDPVLKNRLELLAQSYELALKNEGKSYQLHGSTGKFIVSHHIQRAYTMLMLLTLRHGTNHSLVQEVFEGTVVGEKVDKLQLHRNVELLYSQLLDRVIQKSKKDWTTGGLDIRVLGKKPEAKEKK